MHLIGKLILPLLTYGEKVWKNAKDIQIPEYLMVKNLSPGADGLYSYQENFRDYCLQMIFIGGLKLELILLKF